MKKSIFNPGFIFPVIYNEGLLFQNIENNDEFFLWKDNQLIWYSKDVLEDKEIFYPETLEENLQLNQAIDIIFNRIQNADFIDKNFVKTILNIKKRQEYLKKELLKASIE
jgi:hypothetical protein